MMSLMPTAMPRSGPALTARALLSWQTKAPMVFSCAAIASSDWRDRSIRRKLAGIDPALEIGERDHGHFVSCRNLDRFYEALLDRTSGCAANLPLVMAGLVPGTTTIPHSNKLIAISGWAKLGRHA